MRKIKSKSYLQPLPWRISCFGSSKLSLFLSLDGVSDWIRKGWAHGPNSCAYIGILPSRMHLLVITTHYWLLQFISGHYHPLTTIQFGFQNWWALQIFKMLGPNYYKAHKTPITLSLSGPWILVFARNVNYDFASSLEGSIVGRSEDERNVWLLECIFQVIMVFLV